MKKNITSTILLLLTFVLCANGQEKIFNKQQIQADISFLKSELVKCHPNLYKYTTKERFDFVCDSLIKNAPETADLRQTFIHFLKVVNEIKCGHTYFDVFNKNLIPNTVSFFNTPRFIPIEIYIKDEQIFISRNYSKEKVERGDEIISINETSAKEILQKLKSYSFQQPDGGIQNDIKYFLTANFKFLVYLWLGSQKDYSINLKRVGQPLNENISIKPLSLDAIMREDNTRKIENINDKNNITFAIIDSLPNTAYIRVKNFINIGKVVNLHALSITVPDFENKVAYVFKQLKRYNIKNLIIDFRGNLGGDLSYANSFLAYLIPKDFLTSHISIRDGALAKLPIEHDLLSPSPLNNFKVKIDNDFWQYKYSNVKINPQKQLLFTGNTYLLINSGTFSAASSFCTKLYDEGIGTFIGSSVGGTYNGSSADIFSTLKLPNSNLSLNLPLMRILYNVGKTKKDGSRLKPDFEVSLSFEDFLKKQDSAMNFTIELIKQGKTAR